LVKVIDFFRRESLSIKANFIDNSEKVTIVGVNVVGGYPYVKGSRGVEA
jgi:hypothetical protein